MTDPVRKLELMSRINQTMRSVPPDINAASVYKVLEFKSWYAKINKQVSKTNISVSDLQSILEYVQRRYAS